MRNAAVALLLAACGGARAAPSTPARAATSTEAGPVAADPTCPPDHARLDGACFSVAGTRWWFVTDLPSGGHREFEIVLEPGGRAQVGDAMDTTPDNDGWTQQGALVTITMNDRFVAYTATLENDRELRGSGLNVRQQKWDFVATRRP